MKKIYKLKDLINLEIDIKIPSIIFLYGDLWAWKTTISKHIINNLLWFSWNVKSPTYTYYNEYVGQTWTYKWKKIHHFDLYRLINYDEFFAIWGEEIIDNNEWIILVEWPEILEGYYNADIIIKMKKTDIEYEREIEIVYN